MCVFEMTIERAERRRGPDVRIQVVAQLLHAIETMTAWQLKGV
jgi:hypothetical protein